MKRPYKIMLIMLGALALATLVIVANVNRSHSQVGGIEVNIRYGHSPVLVNEQTIVDSILASIPNLTAKLVGDVDRDAVAEAAAHVPYLRDISIAVSVSGKIVVRAAQRRPIARLIYGSRELYFDNEGCMMPLSRTGDCTVLVAGGNFTEPLRIDSLNSQTLALVKLANFLDTEKKYHNLIDQIYIESDGDIMMVPKLGDHIIELGTTDDLEDKFGNLLAFYRRGMPRAGWNTYSKVSLKYRGQVVCTKEAR